MKLFREKLFREAGTGGISNTELSLHSVGWGWTRQLGQLECPVGGIRQWEDLRGRGWSLVCLEGLTFSFFFICDFL